MARTSSQLTAESAHGEAQLVSRIALGDQAAFETLMRRHNGRLFRVARAILRDESEAEDALQDGYLDAYQRIGEFRGDAQLSTWLTRIVINRALMRLRKQKRERVVVPFGDRANANADRMEADVAHIPDSRAESPGDATIRGEVRRMRERRIDELPVAFLTVFVMREVEDMTVDEVADCLSIPASTVRICLFRARALLREALARDMDTATVEVFGFAGQ